MSLASILYLIFATLVVLWRDITERYLAPGAKFSFETWKKP
jgi:hypothetical protein